jgi:predicted short-subunit dehydrogenase-like oxidoreductase (DUF2520 family)
MGRTIKIFISTQSRPVSLMRELERDSLHEDPACPLPASGGANVLASGGANVLAIVGRGRLGTALAGALGGALGALEWELAGPFVRGYGGRGADAVLLCVPDAEIANAAGLIAPGPLVGHCSGATSVQVLAPHEAFSFHPLLPVIPGQTKFAGAGAAIAGSSPRALAFAASLAHVLGMRTVEIAEEDRTAYHAAASIASNFLVTLEAAAERIAATAGVSRELLAPLVRATVENWTALGPERALTGPVARGDEVTVAAQREAIAGRAPELLTLFDQLVEATRALAAHAAAKQLEPEAA